MTARARWLAGVAAAAAAAAVLLAGCGSGAPAGGPGGRIGHLTVELDWVPNPDHVGLYYAQARGEFARRGLSLSLQAPSDAADPIKLVGLDRVDLAISYESELFYAEQEGLAVTAVAELVPVPLNSLIVAPGAGVRSLSQLRGHTVGLTGIPSDQAFYRTMLRTAGLTAAEVPTVVVNEALVPSLLHGRVSAIIGGYRNVEAIQVRQETGRTPTVFPASALGVPGYAELVVVANRDRLGSSPAYASAVRRFVAGLVTGMAAAQRDPAGATRLMGRVTQYSKRFLAVSVPLTLRLLSPPGGARLGCVDVAGWQRFGDWMRRSRLIGIRPVAARVATAAYLPYRC